MEKKHTIRLRNAVFYAYHGNHREERQLGGKFYVDVEMETDFTEAALADDLSQTINYQTVYALIEAIVTEHKYRLIESVAKCISDSILEQFPSVIAVLVRVRKPGAPVRGVIDTVEVEVHEHR
jgi:dihydroneopterin aldolase